MKPVYHFIIHHFSNLPCTFLFILCVYFFPEKSPDTPIHHWILPHFFIPQLSSTLFTPRLSATPISVVFSILLCMPFSCHLHFEFFSSENTKTFLTTSDLSLDHPQLSIPRSSASAYVAVNYKEKLGRPLN